MGKLSELETDDSATSDHEIAGSIETRAASDSKIDPMPGEIAARNSRPGIARRLRLAALGMAVALAGAGIYASFAHPFGNWSQQRMPANAATGMASSIRQVVMPVSDAEKTAAQLKAAIREIAKAATKGVIHKAQASRRISRLSKAAHNAKTAAPAAK